MSQSYFVTVIILQQASEMTSGSLKPTETLKSKSLKISRGWRINKTGPTVMHKTTTRVGYCHCKPWGQESSSHLTHPSPSLLANKSLTMHALGMCKYLQNRVYGRGQQLHNTPLKTNPHQLALGTDSSSHLDM